MRARFVHENYVGDRKKQLSSSDNYEVTGINNISGSGDLFIRNQRTGKIEKCDSTDWNDARKYSSVIIENTGFKRGEDPYDKLSIGKDYYKKGDEFITIKDFIPSGSYGIPGNTILIVNTPNYREDGVRFETTYGRPIWLRNNQLQHIKKLNESINFKRGEDPYKKLGLGRARWTQIDRHDVELKEKIMKRLQKAPPNSQSPSLDPANITNKVHIAIIKNQIEKIENKYKNIKESTSFKRGENPYQQLDLGEFRPFELGDKFRVLQTLWWEYDERKDLGKYVISPPQKNNFTKVGTNDGPILYENNIIEIYEIGHTVIWAYILSRRENQADWTTFDEIWLKENLNLFIRL